MSATETRPDGPVPEEAGPISSFIPIVARTHRTLALALLRDIGLSPGQELLLMQLWGQEPQSQAELAEHMCVEPPTATKMLGRMERSGVIARERSTTDRRVTLVSLTDKGRDLREPVLRIWAELEQIAVGDFTDDERATLLGLLTRVVANVNRYTDSRPVAAPEGA